MKRLSNISPFILLLVPVFIMMLFTFTTSLSGTTSQSNEVVLKNTGAATLAKVSTNPAK
ncbi:hypothetical protein [Pedobacter duraquae]|uniref:Uncharacterized protein n=1 Tax=Pedobacter duraquae TaxID=425511 RepID=A0A4R6IHM0_9SPHI|nr:hypothetical protein [Pedobacter duraquae]TDO21498.1 hypothetical protein CLV32_2603 [Pedobacter duraquae]